MVIYFIIVFVGAFMAGKLILGELRKEKNESGAISSSKIQSPLLIEENDTRDLFLPDKSDAQKLSEQLSKMEMMLKEKNAEIKKIHDMLVIERKQKIEIEKIKSLLEWQVFESRQMNKDIRKQLSEINNQTISVQEEAARLKSDLLYKDQLLSHNEMVVNELKNRLLSFLSSDENPATMPQPFTNQEKNKIF